MAQFRDLFVRAKTGALLPIVLSVSLALLAAWVAFLFIRAIYYGIRSWRHPSSGPFWSSFGRLWYLYQVARADWHKTTVQLHRKHGAVVRMYPGCYSIDDPAAMKQIYGPGTAFGRKSEWYIASGTPDAKTWPQNLLAERDPKIHAEERRRFASLYSMSAMVKMEESVDDCIAQFRERLSAVSKSKEVIDMQYWIQCYAFDAISLITLSKRFGFLDNCRDVLNLFPVTRRFSRKSGLIGVYPDLHAPLAKLELKLGINERANVQGFMMEQINDLQKDPVGLDKSENFLAKALQMHQQEKLSMFDVLNAISLNIGGGSDSTSIAIASVLYFLTKSPDVLQKLRVELAKYATKHTPGGYIKYNEAQKLPYLQAVIKEAMRIFPPFACILGREVPKGGAVVAGMYFPEGATVGINAWAAHYNRDVFGSDADEFNPDRWLSRGKEVTRRMEEYYLPFGSGQRTCIGKNISLMQISKIIPMLVREFDFEFEHPDAELECDMAQFVWQTNFFVKVREHE